MDESTKKNLVIGVMVFLMVSSLAAFAAMNNSRGTTQPNQALQGDILIDVRCGNQTYPVAVDSRYWVENQTGIMLGDQECEVL